MTNSADSADTDLGETIRRRLRAASLPRSTLAPALSYGRHRGPAPGGARVAAVAVTLFQENDGQWMMPLTLRPQFLQHHGGQVCLPGGRLEPDEDPYTAALREFTEELGVEPKVLQRCGELSTQYVYASDNVVHPVVIVVERPEEPWRPDPAEVQQVIPFPLSILLGRAGRTELTQQRAVRLGDQEVGQFAFAAPAFQHGPFAIWGATALILDELAQILLPGNR